MTYPLRKRLLISLLLILCLTLTASCGTSDSDSSSQIADNNGAKADELPPVEGDNIESIDYSDEDNWASLSQSDSASLSAGANDSGTSGGIDTDVDVFCFYPTSYDGKDGYVADINNEAMRKGATGFIKNKASAFGTVGDIYTPYYRQLKVGWVLTLPLDEQPQYFKGVPMTDIVAAFDYYIKNYNEGKPFIIVGHSQGAVMAKLLLETYLKDNPEVMDRVVAAYITGFYVTEDEVAAHDNWKFAESEDDTGVIISYNTVSPDTDLSKLTVWHEGALAINPISWTRTSETASAESNLGSYVKVGDEYKKVDGLADATVDTENGVIICDSLDEEQKKKYAKPEASSFLFSNGSYHGNDISFYYYNLRENAEKRVKAFLDSNS